MAKTIALELTPDSKKSGLGASHMGDYINICLRSLPQGISGEEQMKRLRVKAAVDKLVKDKEDDKFPLTLTLEDADVETLIMCTKSMKWGVLHEDIGRFHKKMLKLEEDLKK